MSDKNNIDIILDVSYHTKKQKQVYKKNTVASTQLTS